MNTKKYYLHNGSEQEGPFDFEELKAKNISKETQIWYEELPDWISAGSIVELNDFFKQNTPPPIPPKKDSNSKAANEKKKTESWRSIFIKTALVSSAIFGGLFLFSSLDKNENQSYYENKMTVAQIEESEPLRFLRVEGKYNESFWGSEIKIEGAIINKATVSDYKDVTIRVTYYSKTKSNLGHKDHTIYEIFSPTSTTPFKFRVDNYKDVKIIDLDIVDAKPN